MRYFTLLVISCVIMWSCGDDDDDDDTSPLVGSWTSTTLSITDCEDGSVDIVDLGCGGCFSNDFNSDGTFSTRVLVPGSIDSTMMGIYTTSGNVLTTCDEDGNNCETSNFSVSGDMLLLSTEGLGCLLEVDLERS